MKTLDTGDDKIKKICDAIRNETLEPAKQEGKKIIDDANNEAERIIQDATKKAEELLAEARSKIEQERSVLQSSMQQAVKQSLESLKQQVESNLFNTELEKMVVANTKDTNVVADLIKAMVEAIKREGISVDFSALVPKSVSVESVNAALGGAVLNELRKNSVALGSFDGGAQIKLHDRNMTVDMSEESLKELLSRNVRKGFREMVFAG